MQFFFKDYAYSFQSLRALSTMNAAGADIGECLTICSAIEENNDDSWFNAWNAMAIKIENEGNLYEKKGHLASAKTAFLRASTYFRSAEFFLHTNPDDPRIIQTSRKARASFEKATRFFSHPMHKVNISFETGTLPAFLCLVDKEPTKRPLLIIQTGFDGTKEELYSVIGHAAVERGYHCLLFEGPGQGEMIREHNMPFRSNWETVITPVVDYALTLQMVEKENIALMGLSMGGYLVPRALAFEKRIPIGIVNGGVFDFHEVCLQGQSPEIDKQIDSVEGAAKFDKECKELMEKNTEVRWGVGHGMYAFRAKTPSEWLKMTRAYNLKEVADKIQCSMLVVDSDEDKQMKGQSEKLFKALNCPKDTLSFKSSHGAGLHCQIGAYAVSNEKILNWLDENMALKKVGAGR